LFDQPECRPILDGLNHQASVSPAIQQSGAVKDRGVMGGVAVREVQFDG
jgi:hypothetical protein